MEAAGCLCECAQAAALLERQWVRTQSQASKLAPHLRALHAVI